MLGKLYYRVLQDMSYGLYVLTSHDRDKLNGQIVNSITQVTNDPIRVAVTIKKKNFTHQLISKSKVFALSVLDNLTPKSFLRLFGFQSGRDVDKFSNVQFKEGSSGCPIIMENALSVLEAAVFKRIDLGTHTVFIGNAISSERFTKGPSLTYRYYQSKLNMGIPRNAPSYIPALGTK